MEIKGGIKREMMCENIVNGLDKADMFDVLYDATMDNDELLREIVNKYVDTEFDGYVKDLGYAECKVCEKFYGTIDVNVNGVCVNCKGS